MIKEQIENSRDYTTMFAGDETFEVNGEDFSSRFGYVTARNRTCQEFLAGMQ